MNKDYYWEYIELVDEIVNEFVKIVKTQCPKAFIVGISDIQRSVISFLAIILNRNENRDAYNASRKLGIKRSILYKKVLENLLTTYSPVIDSKKIPDLAIPEDNINHKILIKYRGRKLFYCINERQVNYLKPILSEIDEEIILLVTFELDDTIIFDKKILVIEWTIYFEENFLCNNYLSFRFPTLFKDANTFSFIIDTIIPQLVIVLEGCHEDMEILAEMCRSKSIQTVCIQQGWPTFIHTRFKNMGYDHFLTWGREFNVLWKFYNNRIQFSDIGYLYPVANHKTGNAITFFLQAPVMIMDIDHFDEMVTFILFCANEFPKTMIYVREHPECRIENNIRSLLCTHENIKFREDALDVLFADTKISVAIFSSTLMESIVHGCIPFIFNPTSAPPHYPNLEKLGIGVSASTLRLAKQRIVNIVKNKTVMVKIEQNIRRIKDNYFKTHGLPAVKNALNFISKFNGSQL